MGGESLGGRDEIPQLLELLLGRPAWHRDALCREYPELSWFPGRGEPTGPLTAVCARCLVRDECLAQALDAGDRVQGIWGGTSERGRRSLRAGRSTSPAA